jgi:hypothetical protein
MPQSCVDSECKIQASFNTPGLRKPLYCGKHATDAMINVTKRPCHHTGCRTQPFFNLPGSRIGLYCFKHAKTEMINVVSPTCNHTGCKTQPKFNLPDAKKGLYCYNHATTGMINVVSPTCHHSGCKTRSSFNLSGSKKGLYCSKHATNGMVDVVHQTCHHTDCKTRPKFNLPGSKKGLFCAKHAANSMVDVISPKCKSCGLFGADKRNDYLCSYCNPNKAKNRKSKENAVRDLLIKNNITFIQDKTIQNDCCNKSRPDFLIDCGSYFLVLEVDENAHSGYEKECEIIRMNNICHALGLPTKFIRYNPDNKSFTVKQKEAALIETLQACMKDLDSVEPKYLFY